MPPFFDLYANLLKPTSCYPFWRAERKPRGRKDASLKSRSERRKAQRKARA